MSGTSGHAWVKKFSGAITVCDSTGTIIELNDKGVQNFLDEGGEELIDRNLLDYHSEPARIRLKELAPFPSRRLSCKRLDGGV
jgi:hypothetical protein